MKQIRSLYKVFKQSKLIVNFILIIIYYIYFLTIVNYSDTAFFGGDTWEYQSMAVNFAKGHGIQKFGGLEPFENYKFEKFEIKPNYFDNFYNEAGYHFYRTPGYSFFLGIIYKIFGISPLIAKHIQLILLVIVAAFLPNIGQYIYMEFGYLSGLIAGPIYLFYNYKFSEYISTETFCVFTLFLLVNSYIYFEKKKNIISSIFLGIMFGYALLVKGTFTLVPFLFGLYYGIQFIKYHNFKTLKHIFIVFFTIGLVVLPYSIFATKNSVVEETVFISTQSSRALLVSHNEYCDDAYWHPEYKNDPNSFYNNDGMENSNTALRILNFYRHYPSLFFKNSVKKIVAGFFPFPFLLIAIYTLILQGFFNLISKIKLNERIVKKIFYIMIPLSIIFIRYIFIISNDYLKVTHLLTKYPILSILFVTTIAALIFFKYKTILKTHVFFNIILLNFILITIIFVVDDAIYPSRYVKTMDFIFILVGSCIIVKFLNESILKYYRQNV